PREVAGVKKIARTHLPSLEQITLFSVLFLARLSFAQVPANAASPETSKNTPSTHVSKGTKPEAQAPKLTPEQERGLRLLKAAEAEAAGLQPDMHAFVLWRASSA